MAKAKKTTQSPEVPAAAAAATDVKAKKGAAKAATPPAPKVQDMPLIDTNLAASTAAKLVAHRDDLEAASTPASGESAAFKHLKENLHKPVGGSAPSFLKNALPAKKFNNSVPGRHQQLGRGQTFGADVNRTGVPRRTGG